MKDAIWPGDSQVLRLPSGKDLSYARLGRIQEKGPVIVMFHGRPGSRLAWDYAHQWAQGHQIRLICIDRPGYGYSSVKKSDGILDFMRDVEYFLDDLAVAEFSVYGVSGGGPYAITAAKHFPKSRLLRTCIMAGRTHPSYKQTSINMSDRFWRALHGWPMLYRVSQWLGGGGAWKFQADLYRQILDAKDNKIQISRAYARVNEEGRQGQAGWEKDGQLAARDWGYRLEDVDANPIRWYHGGLDTNTSSSAARKTVDALKRSQTRIEYKEYLEYDHYTLQGKFDEEALKWLASATMGSRQNIGLRTPWETTATKVYLLRRRPRAMMVKSPKR